jgi:hypothetical protein
MTIDNEILKKIESKNRNVKFHGLSVFDNSGKINPPITLFVFYDKNEKKYFALDEKLLESKGEELNA